QRGVARRRGRHTRRRLPRGGEPGDPRPLPPGHGGPDRLDRPGRRAVVPPPPRRGRMARRLGRDDHLRLARPHRHLGPRPLRARDRLHRAPAPPVRPGARRRRHGRLRLPRVDLPLLARARPDRHGPHRPRPGHLRARHRGPRDRGRRRRGGSAALRDHHPGGAQRAQPRRAPARPGARGRPALGLAHLRPGRGRPRAAVVLLTVAVAGHPMRPDLLRRVTAERAVRRHLAGTLCAAAAAGLLVLAQAELLAGLLSGRFPGTAAAALAAVAALRAFLVRVQGGCAARTATAVKSALRHRLLARLGDPGPARPAGHRTGELITLAGRGLDGLGPYLTGYLPAAAVAAVVPLAVVARLLAADPASAVIVLVTLPLIPVFGALVGTHTKAVTERQWRTLSRLGGHFLDVVRGLPTLRAFNRAAHQAEVIRRMAGAHRSATMRALRVAFLSSLVLELCASLSLALVAVPI